jgi:hypothetical protein
MQPLRLTLTAWIRRVFVVSLLALTGIMAVLLVSPANGGTPAIEAADAPTELATSTPTPPPSATPTHADSLPTSTRTATPTSTPEVLFAGFVQICRIAGDPAVTGPFTFTIVGPVSSQSISLTPGTAAAPSCSAPVVVPAVLHLGQSVTVAITEATRPGVALSSVSARSVGDPATAPDRLLSSDLSAGTATVAIVGSFTGAGTIVTFTNHSVPTAACVLSQGFFKSHPEALPATLNLGLPTTATATTLTREQLLALLETAPHGNALVQLEHQLIAALSNQARGVPVPAGVQAAITAARTLIAQPGIGVFGVLKPVASVTTNGQTFTVAQLTEILSAFNEGAFSGGPPACDEQDSTLLLS